MQRKIMQRKISAEKNKMNIGVYCTKTQCQRRATKCTKTYCTKTHWGILMQRKISAKKNKTQCQHRATQTALKHSANTSEHENQNKISAENTRTSLKLLYL
jgi:hypothetical protein